MIKVAVRMPPVFPDPGDILADVRALDAAGADTVWFPAGAPEHWALLGAVAEATGRIRIGLVQAAGAGAAVAVLAKLAGGRVVLDDRPSGEKWTAIAMPEDRESWSAALRDHEAQGVIGVIVPWDPRLIDLLRNPGEDDRSDLLMSTG